ncbi:hypothetical protein M23134_07602 [Microscilla marina ATCC 23134]|uniref:Uncharacterized protein n=1 Tax=Microscilla marina ATCC 23134 TaxID=313606 RepID=A1ZF90_MICM2|nr:hypothetical protein M23134_07602 [Microscilla marina ATCC 23134]
MIFSVIYKKRSQKQVLFLKKALRYYSDSLLIFVLAVNINTPQ